MGFRAEITTSNDLPPALLDGLREMIGQLPIVFALRTGGELRVPVAEVDRTGGYILNIEIEGTDFLFKVSKKK